MNEVANYKHSEGTCWSIVALELNYWRAPSIGIPLAIDPQNIVWMVIEPHIWPILDRLPIDWGTFGLYGRRERHFTDKADSHLRYGPIWALVTLAHIYVHVADVDAVHEVFNRWMDFQRLSKMYKVLEVYGPCISTASLKDWPWHRKAENHCRKGHLHSLLNVLAATSFRKSYYCNNTKSYRDALQTVLDNLILLMHVAHAAAAFRQHIEQMVGDELAALNGGCFSAGSLMSSFVRALGVNQKKKAKGQELLKDLSMDKIFRNIFVTNFTSHDTTANMLAFIMLLLAACLEVQDWVAEEFEVLVSEDGPLDYHDLFPKLKRCRAVMYETLRLYPPVMAILKWTSEHPHTLIVGDRTVIISPNTGVSPSILALHTRPDIWEEPLTWKPARWVSSTTPHSIEDEMLLRMRYADRVCINYRPIR
ncbi:cytochrome P450 [Aspergillus stella-maris]|uniref:cytochrome P450 n=1 Tax=Aspergillus stella-maris TaxID=1810926 RepID=UPI003CCDE090